MAWQIMTVTKRLQCLNCTGMAFEVLGREKE